MTSSIASDDDFFQSSDDEESIQLINQPKGSKSIPNEPWIIEIVKLHADDILHLYSPIIWCVLLVTFVDAQALFSLWYMPFLGVLAAFLANSVPIGGGIVYIPALTLLGAQITLGASFTIATMPIGNGTFGFLRWLLKDPTIFIWESFPYTVIPNWIGCIIAMYFLPTPDQSLIKLCFGFFSFCIGILVVVSINRGGLRNILLDWIPTPTPTANTKASSSIPSHPHPHHSGKVDVSVYWWWGIALLSLAQGIVLTPNIGIGPALITYFLLVLVGHDDERAMITGIVTGGWVCIVPFGINLFRQEVPFPLWVMVLPGVYYGAKFSPYLIEWIGKTNVMIAFAIFLFLSALIFWLH